MPKKQVEDKQVTVKDNRLGAAALILRIGLGLVFIITGAIKLLAADPFAVFVESLGIFPFSSLIVTYLLGIVELALGLLLFIGFLTRIVSILTAALLVIFLAFVMFFLDQNPVNIGLIAAAVVIIILGPGNLAIDNILGK